MSSKRFSFEQPRQESESSGRCRPNPKFSVQRATSRNFIDSATFSMSSAVAPLATAAATIAPELTPRSR